MASGKVLRKETLTTIRKADNTFTTDLASTMTCMMQHFIPEDKREDDDEHHKEIRKRVNIPINTVDDVPFTTYEIRNGISKFDLRKAPGMDGLTSEIHSRAFELFPLFTTEVYNSCLRAAHFPNIWKTAQIVPMIKPGKEKLLDV